MTEITGPVMRRVAEMICGDPPFGEKFPYRSGGLLTQFFDDIWLDHAHDGSTRRYWVESVLKEEATDELYPNRYLLTENLRKIVGYLVDPIHFGTDEQHERAIGDLNETLSHAGLQVLFDPQNRIASIVDSRTLKTLSMSEPSAIIDLAGYAIVAPRAFDIPKRRTLDKPQCGVLMPYGGLFDEIYEKDIAQAAVAAGFEPLRADELWRDEKVMNDIVDLIFHSTVLVVDLTDRNPNVFYELGIAHLFGRTVVPIVQDPDDVPFDLRPHRYLEYLPTTSGRAKLRSELQRRLETLGP